MIVVTGHLAKLKLMNLSFNTSSAFFFSFLSVPARALTCCFDDQLTSS